MPSNEIKFLGVLFTSNLKWKKHHELIRTRCRTRLNCIRSIAGMNGCSANVLTKLYKQYVQPLMEYGCEITSQCDSQHIKRLLQTVQNNGIRIAHRLPIYWPTNRVKDIGQLLPIQDVMRERRDRYEGKKGPLRIQGPPTNRALRNHYKECFL